MLEKGETPNRYNLLENGDFSEGRRYFEESGNIGSSDGIVTDTSGSHPSHAVGQGIQDHGERGAAEMDLPDDTGSWGEG